MCVSSVLTAANSTTPRHTHTPTCTHVLGGKCGESSPSVRVVIRLPSINTRGCGGGWAAGVWACGCVPASVYLCFSFVYVYIIMWEYIVNCERCLCVCTEGLWMCSCMLTTPSRRVHGDPKVWMHLLEEISSRCEQCTKAEKTCSKTSLFTHSKTTRHSGGKAQTAVFSHYNLA